jgi:hypothetical protein
VLFILHILFSYFQGGPAQNYCEHVISNTFLVLMDNYFWMIVYLNFQPPKISAVLKRFVKAKQREKKLNDIIANSKKIKQLFYFPHVKKSWTLVVHACNPSYLGG